MALPSRRRRVARNLRASSPANWCVSMQWTSEEYSYSRVVTQRDLRETFPQMRRIDMGFSKLLQAPQEPNAAEAIFASHQKHRSCVSASL